MTGYRDERQPPPGFLPQDDETLTLETNDLAIQAFEKAALGTEMNVPISMVRPSQADDAKRNPSPEAVPAYMAITSDGTKILVLIHGNHRYYTHVSRDKKLIRVKKAQDPSY